MQRDIDLDQIIQVLNFSASQQEHMSFRLSDDYQPNYFRYSKDEQLQEITFNLSNEEDAQQLNEPNENDLKITEVSPEEKVAFILEEEKEESTTRPTQEKQATITKKISLNKKFSIKASERLKKKISLKKDSDEFTKKYDDLFDQIFFKEKQKEKKKEPVKQQPEDKKENSIAQTNNETLQNSNASSVNGLSISRAIDEALVDGFNFCLNSETKIPNPKVNITYETKIVINIRPPKQLIVAQQNQANTSKPKIKFSYGQTEASIGSKKEISLINIPYHKSQQRRLPIFLVNFRNKTNSYPNFYSKKGFNEEICSKLNLQFISILDECKNAIKTLKQSHLKLHELFTNIRQLYKLMSYNILNHQSQQDQQLLGYFLDKDWENYLKVEELRVIQPRDHFIGRPFNELEFITFLNNFEEIVDRLSIEAVLNHENPETIKTYMDGRDQLWGIEKNLRLLSEDLYLYTISHFNLPSHFIESHRLLTAVRNNQELVFDLEKEKLIKSILFLQERKDVFGSSWLGIHTIECLCNLQK